MYIEFSKRGVYLHNGSKAAASSWDGFGRDVRQALISHFISAADFVDAYRNVLWLYRAINVKATTAANVRQIVMRGDQEVENPSDELLTLLRRPNRYQTGKRFNRTIITHLELTGNAIVLKNQINGYGQPKELHLLRPSRVRPIYDDTGIVSYEYTVNGQRKVYLPEEIMHFQYPDPENPLWGLGSVEVGVRTLDLDRYLSEWALNHFANGAKPSGVIKTDSTDLKVLERIADQFRANHQGPRNANRTAVLPTGYEYIPHEANPVNNALVDVDSAGRDKILSLIGVPKQKIGIFEDANYRSTDADNYFYAEVISPLLESDIAPVYSELAEAYGYTLQYEDVDVQDKDAASKRAQAMISTGAFTRNEIRAQMELAELDGDLGAEILGPLNVVSLGAAPAKGVSRSAAKSVKAKQVDGSKLVAMRDRWLDKAAEQWESKAADLLKKEGEAVISAIEARGKSKGKYKFTPEDLYDTAAAEEAWLELCLQLYTATGSAVTDNLSSLFPDLAWDADDPAVAKVLDSIARREGAAVKGVPETTLDRIREQVTEAQRRGYSLDQLVNGVNKPDEQFTGLTKLWADFTPYRSQMIARTELAAAYNLIGNHQYEQVGVTHVEVLDGDDGDEWACDCAEINGQVWTLEEANERALEHPQCVRAFAPVIPDSA
ncbi:MAG: phage portal protein [Chloroflexota bacterium]|nr:phage portal protein [Chloroflexota bacterium]